MKGQVPPLMEFILAGKTDTSVDENNDLFIVMVGDVQGVGIHFTAVVDSTMCGSPQRSYINQFSVDDW